MESVFKILLGLWIISPFILLMHIQYLNEANNIKDDAIKDLKNDLDYWKNENPSKGN